MLPYNQNSYKEALHGGHAAHNPPTLEEAIKRSQEFLLAHQHPEGFWWGDLECNVTSASHTLILYKILGIADRYPLHKFEKYLRRMQCSHGGWEMSFGDGGYLSATIEAYICLRLLNVPQSDPALQRALKNILARGGVTKARVFTKVCLALLGGFDWAALPSLPPWLMLFPAWFPWNIYEAASWARGCVVPLIVLLEKKPVFQVKPEVSFDELYVEGRAHACKALPFSAHDWVSNIFVAADRAFKLMERFGAVPFRQWSIKEAKKWVLDRQEEMGDFIGYNPPMLYFAVCLKLWGYEVTDPLLQRALLAHKKLTVETEDECWLQSSQSPVWDTALVIPALVESGLPPDHPALQKAGQWLLEKQILKHGDWALKTGGGRMQDDIGGGWAFQFVNSWYPDVDDSAAVVIALNCIKMPDEDVKNGAIARCLKWIAFMQGRNGGWAAFDRDSNQRWMDATPFSDIEAMLDVSTADVTARVLEMVGLMRLKHAAQPANNSLGKAHRHISTESIARGVDYLTKEQEKEGCWWGRWGVNYIYGTRGALMGLSQVAAKTHKKEIARGAAWLVKVQNKKNEKKQGAQDGGWGEACFSYDDPATKGQNSRSTASQTGWAMQGLLAAGEVLGRKYEMEAVEEGVQFLLDTQRKDGSWSEAEFTGGGFPKHYYLKYHYFAQHFPLSALARYRARLLQLSRPKNQA
uniref:Terpene cyclase/mutase family member n=1 Tax=Goniophlebium niponicum TaxID=126675 RepID=D0G7G3_9MONI|nr:tirucalladiene synthase [Goniophlebium niponicum]